MGRNRAERVPTTSTGPLFVPVVAPMREKVCSRRLGLW
jgi:hypothetical protein